MAPKVKTNAAEHIERLRELHFAWTRQHHSRITKSAEGVDRMLARKEPPGILIGYANKEELEPSGRVLPGHVER